jgi:hypothetical protein
MDTLLLSVPAWDLMLDVSGNIALATGAYAQAQDAASAIRLFKGELYYDVSQGIPYWTEILGFLPPLSLISAKFIAAAKTVPGVVSATCTLQLDRTLREISGGVVEITNNVGQTASASF